VAWYSSFRGRVVLVTGASSGIGRATALAFGAAGAKLGLVARRREALEEVAAAIRASGGDALVVPTDVTDAGAVAASFARTADRFGAVHVVVNNAGLLIPSPVPEIRRADFQAMLDVNLFGGLAVMQEAVRLMRRQGDGAIVNVASLAGRRGVSPVGAYCATKFALVGLTEALRMELHGEPIHVSLVMPGAVDTPMVTAVDLDPEFVELWPASLNMPPSWVVWAIFAAVRFGLVEISVPPGAGTFEKLVALAPGVADSIVHWLTRTSQWLAQAAPGGR
jgi:NAD(P)-dependent dehydrogenase (short-subunit alcohol dehydrogenase family)